MSVIRIELDSATLDRTRIAISPLWETICSLFLLDRHPVAPFPYERWAIRARTALLANPHPRYLDLPMRFPDILGPAPQNATPTIEEELAILRATPREAIQEALAGYDSPALRMYAEPGGIDRFADALRAYWDAAMAPVWPAMRAALDEEVLLRARALAATGPDALLADLHARVRWEKPVLTLVKKLEDSFVANDKRLLLIPLIFSRGALMCSTDQADVVAVSYQSRGAAVLSEGRATDTGPDDRLALLVGRGRATILRALLTPSTTAGLALTLSLAPSTVSEHLSVLVEAGVAYRRRVGRRVLYGLEPAGVALVSLISPPAERAA